MIETEIAEPRAVGREPGGQQLTALPTPIAPELEDVGSVEPDRQPYSGLAPGRARSSDRQLLAQARTKRPAAPKSEPGRSGQGQHDRVGSGGSLGSPVRGQDRTVAVDPKVKPADEPGVAEVQPETARSGLDLAEGIAQQAQPIFLEQPHGRTRDFT